MAGANTCVRGLAPRAAFISGAGPGLISVPLAELDLSHHFKLASNRGAPFQWDAPPLTRQEWVPCCPLRPGARKAAGARGVPHV